MNIDVAQRLTNLELAVFGGPNVSSSLPACVPVLLAPASASAIQNVQSPLEASALIGPHQVPPTNLTGSTDALPLEGECYISTAGVDATTLATPTAGGPGTGDDGKCLRVTDVGGHAHTITTASNKVVPSHHLLTFNGTAGSFVELQAFNGLWYVKAINGVTPS